MAAPPTLDPQAGTKPISSVPQEVSDLMEKREIVATLQGYKREAEEARKGGENPRDQKWEENLNLYWNRYDFSKKAAWQAKETMPEVPSFVDRFAAALKEALMATNSDFYTVEDPADTEGDLAQAVKRMTDMWLSQSGQNANGTPLPFETVFEDQMKLGALMATSSIVTWKDDVPGGRVAIDTVDPRKVWLDHTFRNLYRFRRSEVDKHELKAMAKQKDSKGNPLFDTEEIDNLVTSVMLMDQQRTEQLTGGGANISTPRSPIVLDEYIATVISNRGEKTYEKSLFVVANDQHLIRGPEGNPFWHGKDWLTYAPLVSVPLSVYGRSYMEDFGSVARTFTHLTNLILDATFTASLRAWAIVPGMLANPGQLAEGMTPNKMFLLEDGYQAQDFAKALEMGTLPPEAIKVWQMLKQELSEAASINEIGLGQFAPKGRTSATEVMGTQQSSSAMIRSVAASIETRWLNPTLDLTWKTGLQHVSKGDKQIIAAAGEEMFASLYQRRRELVTRPLTFRAGGLSAMIQRAATLKALLGVFQVVGSNPVLAQQFLQVIDMGKFIDLLLQLNNIDKTKLQASARDQMIKQLTQQSQQTQGGALQGGGGGPGGKEMQSLASTLGVGSPGAGTM